MVMIILIEIRISGFQGGISQRTENMAKKFTVFCNKFKKYCEVNAILNILNFRPITTQTKMIYITAFINLSQKIHSNRWRDTQLLDRKNQ